MKTPLVFTSTLLTILFLVAFVCQKTLADTHYVTVNNPTPSAPYTSWATAATNIQAAVDAATASDTVLVTNGTYYPADQISVARALTVKSVNGAAVTIVDGNRAHRCFNVSAQGVVIEGFTITHAFHHGNWEQSGSGAGISSTESIQILSCVFVSNDAFAAFGPAINVTESTIVSNCCFISHNPQESYAIAMWGCYYDCIFENNQAYYWGTLGYPSRVDRCVFRNCSAVSALGSAILLYGWQDHTEIRNCLFERCGGPSVIYNSLENDFGIENCTFVGNEGVCINSAYHDGFVYNCIFHNNSQPAITGTLADIVVAYCCSDEYYAGPGNTTSDPLFVSTNAADYHLLWGSPCINAGTNLPWMIGATDLDGNPRIIDDTVDMGAYEYVPEPGSMIVILSLLLCLLRGTGRYGGQVWIIDSHPTRTIDDLC